MRAAAVQLNSTTDKAANLEVTERLVREAASGGAELVALPEKWNLFGPGEDQLAGAEPLDGPSLTAARDWARELGVTVLAGSIAERTDDPAKGFNTSVMIGPDGTDLGVYRKIHLFDVDVEGIAYRESDYERPGDELVIVEIPGDPSRRAGMTICFDLRFPELYRSLALQGAELFTVPAAFTVPTGRAHWDVLQRARAIENQAFVLAPNQVGEVPPHYSSFGHSMIVGPYGAVLAMREDGVGVVIADLDFDERARVLEEMPLLASRRPDTYHELEPH